MLGGLFDPLRRVEGLGRDVSPVGPTDGASFDEDPLEVGGILQRLERRSLEPLPKVDGLLPPSLNQR